MAEGNDQGGAGASQDGGNGSGAAPPVVNSDKFDIVHEGKTITLTKDDVIKNAQMGYDYTRKTQTLSEDRKKFKQMVEDRALDIYRKALEEQKQTQSTQDEDPNAVVAKKLSEVEGKLDKFEQAERHKKANQELDQLLNTLGKKYQGLSDVDRKIILVRFHEQANDESDPDALFDSLFAARSKERADEKQAVIDEYVKAKTKDPFASGETGKGGSPAQSTSKPPQTFAEARARADLRLKALGMGT